MKKLLLLLMLLLPALAILSDNPEYCGDKGTFWSITDALKQPENVISLTIPLQQIANLTPDIAKFVNLECLDVSYNDMSDFPAEITKLKKLRYLKMSGMTKITSLPRILKQIPSLKVIELTDYPEWKEFQYEDATRLLPKVKFIRNDVYQR